jgi:predicted HAD superfamily Cof-like phosphohydrolase
MNIQLDLVTAFHHSFHIPVRPTPTAEIPEAEMRHEIMREENDEYREACQKGDLIAIADALGDQLYVLCGTIIAHGLQDKIAEVFAEIHRSNMSKLDADGQPILRTDGKILKSAAYFRPQLAPILGVES